MAEVHKRQAIRETIVDLLKGRTRCGDRVFSNRGRSFFASELPSLTVYTEAETSEFMLPPQNALKRTLTVVVECALIMEQHIDNEIDDLAGEVEEVLQSKGAVSELYQGLLESFRLTGTETAVAERGEKVLGSARLTYEAEYET